MKIKLKYKKIIMLTTMSTMGIGLLTLSVSRDYPRAEERNPATQLVAGMTEADMEVNSFGLGMEEIEAEPTPTPIPTPTPMPIYQIEEVDNYEDINHLFNEYYIAKNSNDIEKLQSMLSDPTMVENKEQLEDKTEFIDDYRNIKSYVKKGPEEGSFIVYVYHEIKFTSVNTPAPGLSKFYLITEPSGELKIFSGFMEEHLREYYYARNYDEDVQEIIQKTIEKGEEAKNKDIDLQKFWEEIENIASQGEQEIEEAIE